MTNAIDTNEFHGETTIGGVVYQVSGLDMCGKKVIWVRVQRVQKDGSTVWAFLSARQRSAEANAKRRFADQISKFLGK